MRTLEEIEEPKIPGQLADGTGLLVLLRANETDREWLHFEGTSSGFITVAAVNSCRQTVAH